VRKSAVSGYIRRSKQDVVPKVRFSSISVGALLGHTQVQTTLRYSHLADDPLQEATNRVDALLTALAGEKTAEVTPLKKSS